MIGTYEIKCHAAKPQMPLPPMFAFKDSPSSLRLLEIPKKIGEWNITTVKVAVNYPDNTTNIYTASRNGNVWVVTFNGCSITGKVANGLEILADGIDENGDAVNGYVLGVGDIYILDRDADIEEAVSKHTMRYCDETPETPVGGDVVIENGTLKIYDGTQWISVDIDLSEYATKSELETTSEELRGAIDEVASDIPTATSELENDSGFITSANVPTKTSDLTNDSDFTTTNEVNQMISVKRDLTDLNYVRAVDYSHPERIVGFYDGSTYTRFEKVSDTLYKWHLSNWDGDSIDDYHIELSLENPAEPIFSYYRGNGDLITTFTIPNGATSFRWNFIDHSMQKVLELLSEDTIALKNDLISQFRNDSGYLTKVDVVPADGQYTGYADKARTTGGVGATYSTNDTLVIPALGDFAYVAALWDNTNGCILRAYTYENYPWKLSMLNGTTFEPPIELKWGYWYISRKVGRVVKIVWRGLGWMSDYVDGVAYLIGNTNSDGSTVDLHLTIFQGSTLTSTYTSKAITLDQYGYNIETYDGQTDVITCTRDYITKGIKSTRYVAYQDELPTKVSDLTNDAGYLTTVSWNDVQDKPSIPTKTSDLTNDSDFTTNTALENYLPLSGDATADVVTRSLSADGRLITGDPNVNDTIGPDEGGSHYGGVLIHDGCVDIQNTKATSTIEWYGTKIDAFGVITIKEKDAAEDVIEYDKLKLPKTNT